MEVKSLFKYKSVCGFRESEGPGLEAEALGEVIVLQGSAMDPTALGRPILKAGELLHIYLLFAGGDRHRFRSRYYCRGGTDPVCGAYLLVVHVNVFGDKALSAHSLSGAYDMLCL